MIYSAGEIWTLIILIGAGTYLIRFSFLGFMGGRSYPDWILRVLRYTPVALIPGLVAPLVVWPAATGGAPDLPRLLSAGATLVVGIWTKSIFAAVGAGAATLYLSLSMV
jgi:branched-subunit amino acid transport protein